MQGHERSRQHDTHGSGSTSGAGDKQEGTYGTGDEDDGTGGPRDSHAAAEGNPFARCRLKRAHPLNGSTSGTGSASGTGSTGKTG